MRFASKRRVRQVRLPFLRATEVCSGRKGGIGRWDVDGSSLHAAFVSCGASVLSRAHAAQCDPGEEACVTLAGYRCKLLGVLGSPQVSSAAKLLVECIVVEVIASSV